MHYHFSTFFMVS